MATSNMSRLDAVNQILSATGDEPVSSLTEESGSDSVAAELRLDEETRNVQIEGWYFNTVKRTFVPNASGNILIPGTILQVDAPWDTRYTVRSGLLFDLINNTSAFSSSVTIGVIEQLSWDDIPPPAKAYIVAIASKKYADRQLTDPQLSAILREDAMYALIALKRAHLRAGNYSVLGPQEGRVQYLNGQPIL
jgi:hypothetical protein